MIQIPIAKMAPNIDFIVKSPRCSTPRNGSRRGFSFKVSITVVGFLLATFSAGPVSQGQVSQGQVSVQQVADTKTPVPGLEEALRQADAAGHLPLAFALQTVTTLRVHLHQVKGFDPANFARQPIPLLEAEAAGSSALPEDVPTLYLNSPSYLRDGSWVALVDQTVDVSEYLFNALILAHLELQELDRQTAYAAIMQRRANVLLSALPREHRLEAYLHAVASFGSHALSVANQLERSARRHRRRGTSLCQHFQRRASLFGLWDHIFGSGLYQARYFEPAQGDALTGRWVDTGIGLQRQDKQLFLKSMFLGFWVGEKRADLGRRYCPDED